MGLFAQQPLRRMYLRSFASRQLRRTKDKDEAASLSIMLDDTDAFDAVFDGLNGQYEDEQRRMKAAAAVSTRDPVGGPFQDFLQWLLDNQEGIIAFIKAIIALFSGGA